MNDYTSNPELLAQEDFYDQINGSENTPKLKIGDRVNITMKITQKWQSEAGMHNAIIINLFDCADGSTLYHIREDELSLDMAYHRRLHDGLYYSTSYNIEKI